MTRTDDVRRLTAQSRVRLAALEVLRAEHRRIARHTDRRLEESRRLLDRVHDRRSQRTGEQV